MTSEKTKDLRVPICFFRGLPAYRDEVQKRIKNANKRKIQIDVTSLIERGINLALEEIGEKPVYGRVQGRYHKKV